MLHPHPQVYSLSVKLVAALSKASNRTFDKHSKTNIEIAPPPSLTLSLAFLPTWTLLIGWVISRLGPRSREWLRRRLKVTHLLASCCDLLKIANFKGISLGHCRSLNTIIRVLTKQQQNNYKYREKSVYWLKSTVVIKIYHSDLN